jgi:hypothetical protein
MSRENWRNDTDKETPIYCERNLSRYCFVHNESLVDRPGIETDLPSWDVRDLSTWVTEK